jgi:hypothetical protein
MRSFFTVNPAISSGLVLGLGLMVLASPSFSQSLEPRSYTNVPVGINFAVMGVSRLEGDLAPAPSAPIQDAELTIDILAMGYARTLEVAGNSAKFAVSAARTCYEGTATFLGEFTEGRRCENFDPSIRLGYNFYGAPAKDLREFMSWKPGLVIGTSLQVIAPFGDYTSRQLINAGTNRWVIRPGLGMSYQSGRWLWELAGSVRIFEDNDDFFNNTELEQDPIWQLQAHLTYNFNRGRWLSLNTNFFRGGETTVSGVEKDDYLENARLGVTFSTPLTQRLSLKLFASTSVQTRVGNEFDAYGAALQVRF